MHSVVYERRKFGPLGFCVPYEFNITDLEASLLFLDRHIYNAEAVNQQPSWETIRYMVCMIQYGGRITDQVDFDLFQSYGAEWLDEKIMQSNFVFNSQSEFPYKIPDGTDVNKYREYIDDHVPSIDLPPIFSLHPNADLTFRRRESTEMLGTIMMTQPKEGASTGGKGRNEIVKEKAQELQGKMPPQYVWIEVLEETKRLGGPKGSSEKGKGVPLNNFLTQEIARMMIVIGIVNKILQQIIDAIDGLIIMTPEIVDAIDALFDARVPYEWAYDATGVEISWLLPGLGSWFSSLQDRTNQLSTWLKSGRPTSFWMTGFFNP
jgi:dynein heavy chain